MAMTFELNTDTLQKETVLSLTDRQKELLRKEKSRADFDDKYAPMLTASLNKDGYKWGYACNYEQTKRSSIFNTNQIVIFNDQGEYCTF